MSASFIQAEAARVHTPSLAQEDGMVYQIWEDGEITLQKSGRLLWNRSLHTIHFGIFGVPPMIFPESHGKEDKHSYAFVTKLEADRLRALIQELAKRPSSSTTTGDKEASDSEEWDEEEMEVRKAQQAAQELACKKYSEATSK